MKKNWPLTLALLLGLIVICLGIWFLDTKDIGTFLASITVVIAALIAYQSQLLTIHAAEKKAATDQKEEKHERLQMLLLGSRQLRQNSLAYLAKLKHDTKNYTAQNILLVQIEHYRLVVPEMLMAGRNFLSLFPSDKARDCFSNLILLTAELNQHIDSICRITNLQQELFDKNYPSSLPGLDKDASLQLLANRFEKLPQQLEKQLVCDWKYTSDCLAEINWNAKHLCHLLDDAYLGQPLGTACKLDKEKVAKEEAQYYPPEQHFATQPN